MKKRLLCLLPFLAALAFIFLPSGASDLYVRIYFNEVEGDFCTLYYATDSINLFCIEQHLSSPIEPDTLKAEFCLDASLDGHITGFRLDFPGTKQLLSIRNVTVSSGGVIKRQYNPCDFFAEENISDSHNIDAISLSTASGIAYIGTGPEEAYMILSDQLCREITDCYSHGRLTRFFICLFLLACFCFAKKKLFRDSL